MKKLVLLLLMVASPIFAEVPTLKLPKEISGEPGTFIAVRAESSAAWVNFRASPGLAVFPADLLSDRKATVLTAAKAGHYKLFAYTGNDDGGADAETIITIGKPGPGPDPDPQPDPDPDPDPVVDVPPELLPAVNALKAFGPQRAKLSKFYADFANVLANADVKTTGQFAAAHASALKAFVAASGYAGAPKVGEHIDAYLAECIGGLDDKPLNAELKARLVAALKVISEVLR